MRVSRLNRGGMLQLQAAGVNAFQALAAGMDPFRVACSRAPRSSAPSSRAASSGSASFFRWPGRSAFRLAPSARRPLRWCSNTIARNPFSKSLTTAQNAYKDALDKTNPLLETAAEKQHRLLVENAKTAELALDEVQRKADKSIAKAERGGDAGLFGGRSLQSLRDELQKFQNIPEAGRNKATRDYVELLSQAVYELERQIAAAQELSRQAAEREAGDSRMS